MSMRPGPRCIARGSGNERDGERERGFHAKMGLLPLPTSPREREGSSKQWTGYGLLACERAPVWERPRPRVRVRSVEAVRVRPFQSVASQPPKREQHEQRPRPRHPRLQDGRGCGRAPLLHLPGTIKRASDGSEIASFSSDLYRELHQSIHRSS